MRNILILILTLILIGLVVWDTFVRPVPDPVVVIDYQYETDTVYLDTFYIPGKPYPLPIPPSTITIYEIDSLALDSLSILIQGKNVVIARLQDSIRVHQNYLKQFPQNPKLLAIDLKRDSLSIALLKISGLTQEYRWPINLNQFNYRWDFNNQLSRHPTQPAPIEEKPFAQYFVGAGVDVLYRSPFLSGTIEKEFARVRLYGRTSFGLLDKKANTMQIGIDYRFKWEKR